MTNSKKLLDDDEPIIEDTSTEINSMAEYQQNLKIKVSKKEVPLSDSIFQSKPKIPLFD